jgi:hypothetical protein
MMLAIAIGIVLLSLVVWWAYGETDEDVQRKAHRAELKARGYEDYRCVYCGADYLHEPYCALGHLRGKLVTPPPPTPGSE